MATRNCFSLLQSDVAATINGGTDSNGHSWSAFSDGDVIMLPAGTETWSDTGIIVGGGTGAAGITILGAGIGQTIITGTQSDHGPMLQMEHFGAKYFEVGKMTLINNSSVGNWALQVGHSGADLNYSYRIHDIYFNLVAADSIDADGILLFGTCEGVVDHCTFHCAVDGGKQGVTPFNYANSQNSLVQNNLSASFPSGSAWTTAAVWGDQHRAFVEDCLFDFDYPNDAAIEGYDGAKYCFRYNRVRNSLVGNHGLDSGVCSTHSVECYGNVFICDNGYNGVTYEQRGGTGLVYNNKLVDPSRAFDLKIESYRASGNSVNYNATDDSGGFFINGTSWYDQNAGGAAASGFTPTGYIVLEAIGTTGPVTLSGGHFIAVASPFYEWNNTTGTTEGSQSGTAAITIGPPFTNARFSGTNLVIDGTNNKKVTSATHNFITNGTVSDDLFSWLHITAGTGFTPGWYRIESTSGNAAILSASPGTVGSTGGTWAEVYTPIVPSDVLQSGRDYFPATQLAYTPYTYPHPLNTGHGTAAFTGPGSAAFTGSGLVSFG